MSIFQKYSWLPLAFASIIFLVMVSVLVLDDTGDGLRNKDPWKSLPKRKPHVNHIDLMEGPFPDGPSVTRACLECHPDAAKTMMKTTHWTWESDPVKVPWSKDSIRLGKKHGFNNFCIGIGGNWPKCTSCHPGYGWKDKSFDFENPEMVDCLVCHDGSGQYRKGVSGLPTEDVDLLAVAKSVNNPSRRACGTCHFAGSLANPFEQLDVHMGRHDLRCTDCHRTEDHLISGRSMSVNVGVDKRVDCTDCHGKFRHDDGRINAHLSAVACQTCHILYQKQLKPEYAWYNGTSRVYLPGDSINENGPTLLNRPFGSIRDPKAKIWPFKIRRGKQIYDKLNKNLIRPKTVDRGGYWSEFEWNKAARLGGEISGSGYGGEYGLVETEMYRPVNHMVSDKDKALQCLDCHGEKARMDWKALGYGKDPLRAHNSRKRK